MVRSVCCWLGTMRSDFTVDEDEEGPLKAMVDYYGEELVSTVYSVAHHGGSGKSNKDHFMEAIEPKAIVLSGEVTTVLFSSPEVK